MSCGCGPGACSCGAGNNDYASTLLGGCLIDAVDCARQIATDLGARPYRVFRVKTRWTGEERGDGVENVILQEEITPTPKVSGMDGISLQLQDIGLDEVGTTQVSEISARYTEAQLRTPGLAPNENFYWEIRLAKDGDQNRRRRYMLVGVPSYSATSLQWTIRLTRAGTDRETETGIPG